MEALFTKILDMSLTASIVIGAVLVVRYFLRNAPKAISYALWAVVLFRLLCPVSLTAPVSLLEVSRPQVTAAAGGTSSVSYLPEILPEDPPAAPLTAPELPEFRRETGAEAPASKSAEIGLQTWAAWIWMAGAAVLLLHSLASYLRLYRRLIGAIPYRDRIYLADHIPTPFVLGLWKPKIYLPSGTPEKERNYILAHEEYHIRRWDHIVKLVAYAALCLHWFNPLVWLAFFLAGKDMEMSCDEAVIRQLGPEIRADYAQTLLRLATCQRIPAGLPLAFGEGDTKSRVKNMAKWKRPKTWVVILSAVLCLLVLVVCAVNPSQEAAPAAAASEPAADAKEGPVTMGLSIPLDAIDVDFGAKEKRFFRSEILGGEKQALSDVLGGIRVYDTPEADIQDMEAWLRALGVPQIVNGGYDYMLTGTADGLEASFADAQGQETFHYYFIQGEQVFELWFDTAKLDAMTRAAMLESVYFAPDAEIKRGLPMIGPGTAGEPVATQAVAGDAAQYLELCRTALAELQSRDSYALKIHNDNYGGPILNETSETFYYRDGENWLRIVHIPDEGFQRGFGQFGQMYLDGQYYSNERSGWDENEDIVWEQVEKLPAGTPWLAAFRWEDQEVRFVSAVPAGEGQRITLQIMAPYYTGIEGDEIYDSYQVQLVFDRYGKLSRMEHTVFYHHETEGDYSCRETTQVTNNYHEGFAAEVIRGEYQRYRNQNP